jgi:hypothetical protein
MRMTSKLVVLLSSGVVALAPALALAAGDALAHGKPTTPHGQSRRPSSPTTTSGSTSPSVMPSQAEAYGKLCQGESKTHVKGEKGTAFSRCVVAMAQLAAHKTSNPHEACKTESKKHVDGEHGTAYSRCVAAANKLLRSDRK